MNLNPKPLLVFLLIFICLTSYSQLNSGNLTQFTENDGLPGSQVNKLLVDRFGYVWAGTINGLARFDGYELKRFYSSLLTGRCLYIKFFLEIKIYSIRAVNLVDAKRFRCLFFFNLVTPKDIRNRAIALCNTMALRIGYI